MLVRIYSRISTQVRILTIYASSKDPRRILASGDHYKDPRWHRSSQLGIPIPQRLSQDFTANSYKTILHKESVMLNNMRWIIYQYKKILSYFLTNDISYFKSVDIYVNCRTTRYKYDSRVR